MPCSFIWQLEIISCSEKNLHTVLVVNWDLKETWFAWSFYWCSHAQFKCKCHSFCFVNAPYWNEYHYSMKPLRSPEVPRPQTIFSNPLSPALCVSMCLGKTAFCTNWSQWHRLQGRENKPRLHGNAYWQVCPLRSLQRYVGIVVHTNLKAITKRKQPETQRGTLTVSAKSCSASLYVAQDIKTSQHVRDS